jgi:methylase of polypeptide subunit release factors
MASKHLMPGGAVVMEIAYGQEGDARALASAADLRQVDVRRDFAGIPRVLIAVWEGS